MTPTKLSTMRVYEKNCAVAEKLGHVVLKRGMGSDVLIKTMKLARPANYCNNPKDYMLLAIEYEISIVQKDGMVWAMSATGEASEYYPKDQTGEAVVDAFLMMGIKQN